RRADLVASQLESLVETAVTRALARSRNDRPRKKRATTNMLMADTIQKNPDTVGWTVAQWSQHLRRAKSTVAETPTWKKLEEIRLQNRAERAKDRRRRGGRRTSE